MFYQKYRPEDLEAVRGNEETIESLKALFDSAEPPPHAFLFTGPTGCGKTTLARIVAGMLGCVGGDYREIDSADFRGIDMVREMRKQAQFKPLEGPVRVWLIDEVHAMTAAGMEAMLKLLEDPPKSAYFILATTDPQKLISTIKGRCIHFTVKQLPELELKKLLRGIANKEGFVLPKEVMEQIIEDSQGHPRNAIQLLEQVANVPQEKMLQYVKRAAEVDAEVIQLCRKMIDASPWKAVANVLKGLKENGEDPEGIRRAILGYCTSILLQKEHMRAAAVMECFTENYYNTGFSGLVLSCFTAKCAPQ
jgi:DNA polymerase-3 subunit gamma/tau